MQLWISSWQINRIRILGRRLVRKRRKRCDLSTRSSPPLKQRWISEGKCQVFRHSDPLTEWPQRAGGRAIETKAEGAGETLKLIKVKMFLYDPCGIIQKRLEGWFLISLHQA